MDMGHMSDGWNQSLIGQKASLMYCMSMIPFGESYKLYINPLKRITMSVKDYAVQDIKDDLQRNGKCFIAFITELDETMENLVNEQISLQEHV